VPDYWKPPAASNVSTVLRAFGDHPHIGRRSREIRQCLFIEHQPRTSENRIVELVCGLIYSLNKAAAKRATSCILKGGSVSAMFPILK